MLNERQTSVLKQVNNSEVSGYVAEGEALYSTLRFLWSKGLIDARDSSGDTGNDLIVIGVSDAGNEYLRLM